MKVAYHIWWLGLILLETTDTPVYLLHVRAGLTDQELLLLVDLVTVGQGRLKRLVVHILRVLVLQALR